MSKLNEETTTDWAYWAWLEKLEAAYGRQTREEAASLTRQAPESPDLNTWQGQEELPF
jgi:hypothetical protein